MSNTTSSATQAWSIKTSNKRHISEQISTATDSGDSQRLKSVAAFIISCLKEFLNAPA